jgi:hypothetical protein
MSYTNGLGQAAPLLAASSAGPRAATALTTADISRLAAEHRAAIAAMGPTAPIPCSPQYCLHHDTTRLQASNPAAWRAIYPDCVQCFEAAPVALSRPSTSWVPWAIGGGIAVLGIGAALMIGRRTTPNRRRRAR